MKKITNELIHSFKEYLIEEEKSKLTKAEYERLLTAAKSKGNERLYLLMQTIC